MRNTQQPMGNEKPEQHGFPGRPVSPFASTPQTTPPFPAAGPAVRPEVSGYGAAPQYRFNGPSMPPPPQPSYASTGVGFNPSFPSPQFSSFAQPVPPRGQAFPGQPMPTPGLPSASQPPPPPSVSYRPQQQIPSVPMRPPPQHLNPTLLSGNTPQPAPPPLQHVHGYSYGQADPITTQVPQPQTTPYYVHQGSYGPPPPMTTSGMISREQMQYPGGVPPPPPPVAPSGMFQREQMQYPSGGPPPQPPMTTTGMISRGQMQYPSGGPPVGSLQGLVEEFSSLSVGSVPGSIDPGVDLKTLPRPLDGDVEPKAFTGMYPLNCDPRYLRLTTTAIPNSQSLLSRWHLPLAAVVNPLAEAPEGEEVPVVNFGPMGIIRCRRCRTYVNPYVTFTDGGRKWRCNICALLNDVPGEYFAHLDANCRRVDLDQRPELTKGTVEFLAPTEYMVRPPMPPLYFFLINVSVTAVRSGMLESSLTQPQMMVVSDLEDIFVPLPDDLLVNLSESRNVVDVFLDSLPSMFQDNLNVESAFGPALRATFMVMGQLGGKLLIFQTSLPSLGVGRLRLRGDDPRAYGTDKEYALRVPEDPFYKQMAADLTKYQIGVNVYAFSDKYTDIASLGTLAKYTGGQVYYYPGFQGDIHGAKLRYDLARDLTRETAWESVMRIRCGKGVRFTSYHGHFMLRSTDLLALPSVDCDKAFAMQFALEDQLLITQVVYFQVALLYTSSSGERRIRVHTAAAPVVTDLAEMYRQADAGAIVTLLSRLAVEKTLSSKLEDARHSVQLRIVKALKEYRNLYAVQHRLSGRMIYPESLRFIFLYGLALCKSIPLRGGYADTQLDERCATGFTMMTLSVRRLLKFLYPNLIRIDDYLLKTPADGDDLKILPLVANSLDTRGLYIYDDGLHFVIWFGRSFSPDIASNILGANFSGFTDLSRVYLHEHDNQVSRKLLALLKRCREKDPSSYQLCHLVKQGEQPREVSLLLGNLVEDQIGGTSGYVEWMLQIHRQVQQNP
ncbi:hypothetical protein IFM89_039197 [Coptis chinensis]|uniref:Uncharacterized protein n=1 Tax=Coptis chinensis TaxID=261450 RepID=A0A835LYN0_9MAGN|nr:hypothetical protein IFM89_039197 [Coptis chinensis]